MAGSTAAARGSPMSKYKISRLGRKLQVSDDPRTLLALPKDVPERIWSELLQKEENELVCLDIREEILEAALKIGYDGYMERQTAPFQVHCTAVALLKIIDWQFYRHDPGEEPSAYPPCYIPKRLESWTPDEMPEPSVRDSWSRRDLMVLKPRAEETLPSSRYVTRSIEYPVMEPIPQEYWFPGKINLTTDYISKDGNKKRHIMDEDPRIPFPGWGFFERVSELGGDYDDSAHTIEHLVHHSSEALQHITDYGSKELLVSTPKLRDPNRRRPDVELCGGNGKWVFVELARVESESTVVSKVGVTDSEVLQKVTDYAGEEASVTPESKHSSLKPPTPVDSSLQGAGDSTSAVERVDAKHRSRQYDRRRQSGGFTSRSSTLRTRLPPLVAASLSKVSIISDCRLRNIRMDTHFEVSPEKLESPYAEQTRKKGP